MAPFVTLVADPPWSYNDKLMSGNSGFGKNGRALKRGAANHYKTMSIADIVALGPQCELAENAHCYLWTTNAFMREAHDVMAAWGFTQKTILTWVKARPVNTAGVEHWRVLPSAPTYEVSDRGRVRKGARQIAQKSDAYGYQIVRMFPGRAERKVHQLVMETWIGPCPIDHVIDHWDTDKANNDLWNLEYVTHAENSQRAGALGRMGRPATGTSPSAIWRHQQAQIGMGTYFRNNTEHVLFGVRGKLRTLPPYNLPTHFLAPRGQHSAKPDVFYNLVERASPGPYFEMFARRARPGWTVWGDQAPAAEPLQEAA